jgi:hypothetical protein
MQARTASFFKEASGASTTVERDAWIGEPRRQWAKQVAWCASTPQRRAASSPRNRRGALSIAHRFDGHAWRDDLHTAWHGQLGYDPALVRAPVALIRGEWDGLIPDRDARSLFDSFTAAPIKCDIKISRGTHLMHLETMRYALYRESIGFLRGGDMPPGQVADWHAPVARKDTSCSP